MARQQARQRARSDALELQAGRRAVRLQRGRRLESLAVDVLTALGERDAAVAHFEDRAGQAISRMVEDEGLTLKEVVEWCGDPMTVAMAGRLRRLVGPDGM